MFRIEAVELLNALTFSLRNSNDQFIRGKIYETELVQFQEEGHDQKNNKFWNSHEKG